LDTNQWPWLLPCAHETWSILLFSFVKIALIYYHYPLMLYNSLMDSISIHIFLDYELYTVWPDHL
jgi:hypothetical protein